MNAPRRKRVASITQTLAIYLMGGVHGQMLWQEDAKHVSRYRAVVEHTESNPP
jgi:hypothetical protein